MDPSTQSIVDDLRLRGAERADVELKAARGGVPNAVLETISAFANGTGGTIILGLGDDAQPVPIDARALRDGLAEMAANKLDPPVRGDIEIEVIDGDHRVVRFDVPELDLSLKPCFVATKGKYGGSFIRTGDGDHKLTNYEVDRLLENRTQPRHDREVVLEAGTDDLDPGLLDPYLDRLRETRPRAFDGLDRKAMLVATGIAREVDGVLRPTLAGLLVFGRYPQKYFPQLFISVVVLPGVVMGDLGPDNERFLDNRTIEGPLPEMAAEAVTALARHLSRAAVMQGGQRVERLEYPLEVVRELVANAVMHRDYSPQALGSQVQIELYPDRLVVRSPGGFYGGVDPSDFGAPAVSSSRNELLAKLLADTELPGTKQMVAENRGSGIPGIMRALNRAGMVPPTFNADIRKVEVTVPQHALLTRNVLAWIESLGEQDLTEPQIQALALLHDGQTVRNQTLQGWGVHPSDATHALTNLVRRGLAVKIGDRKGASYALAPGIEAGWQNIRGLTERQRSILGLFDDEAELTATEIAEASEMSYSAIIKDVNHLLEQGLLIATAPPRSRLRAYRLPPNTNG